MKPAPTHFASQTDARARNHPPRFVRIGILDSIDFLRKMRGTCDSTVTPPSHLNDRFPSMSWLDKAKKTNGKTLLLMGNPLLVGIGKEIL